MSPANLPPSEVCADARKLCVGFGNHRDRVDTRFGREQGDERMHRRERPGKGLEERRRFVRYPEHHARGSRDRGKIPIGECDRSYACVDQEIRHVLGDLRIRRQRNDEQAVLAIHTAQSFVEKTAAQIEQLRIVAKEPIRVVKKNATE